MKVVAPDEKRKISDGKSHKLEFSASFQTGRYLTASELDSGSNCSVCLCNGALGTNAMVLWRWGYLSLVTSACYVSLTQPSLQGSCNAIIVASIGRLCASAEA